MTGRGLRADAVRTIIPAFAGMTAKMQLMSFPRRRESMRPVRTRMRVRVPSALPFARASALDGRGFSRPERFAVPAPPAAHSCSGPSPPVRARRAPRAPALSAASVDTPRTLSAIRIASISLSFRQFAAVLRSVRVTASLTRRSRRRRPALSAGALRGLSGRVGSPSIRGVRFNCRRGEIGPVGARLSICNNCGQGAIRGPGKSGRPWPCAALDERRGDLGLPRPVLHGARGP